MNIVEELMQHRDEKYGQFQQKLIPNIPAGTIIGVRTPELRALAKKLAGEDMCGEFLRELPHRYFEENQLHGFVISGMKGFAECICALEEFLPYIDNWATCDQTSPKIFKKNSEQLLPYIEQWLCAEHVYTVRFGIGMMMQHFLDERFQPSYARRVAAIHSEEYYVRMEIAWYMATALAKQWGSVIPILEERLMDPWVHNKTIQKARESYRITPEQKKYLKTLKV